MHTYLPMRISRNLSPFQSSSGRRPSSCRPGPACCARRCSGAAGAVPSSPRFAGRPAPGPCTASAMAFRRAACCSRSCVNRNQPAVARRRSRSHLRLVRARAKGAKFVHLHVSTVTGDSYAIVGHAVWLMVRATDENLRSGAAGLLASRPRRAARAHVT